MLTWLEKAERFGQNIQKENLIFITYMTFVLLGVTASGCFSWLFMVCFIATLVVHDDTT